MRTRKRIARTLLLALLLVGSVTGCTQEPADETSNAPATQTDNAASEGDDATDPANAADSDVFDWTTFELVDVETGETFTIADLASKDVYVQAFAVW